MDRSALYAFLSSNRYGVVSSIGRSGGPQSALVGITVSSELEIVFDTVKSSRKYPNLIANAVCSFVIGWAGEQTVQYEGVAFEPVGEELRRYQEIYFRAWPEGPARLSWPGITHFVVRPRWIRYSDFDQSPPLIQEFELNGGE
ncbi:MAG: pyridoxamine 5'-phosphate oxidase family protein [Acidobacteriaceae bacterium]